ncbi:MAG TPA: cyclopropane-fatty-acyl-phospholipid synthase family protein [Azospirillaceae bacterium]|nr:cyclopropane-fatty-acyl-phospholipid synthase family protein [Azospirillaceae bacterium]
MLLAHLLRRAITQGRLDIIDAQGHAHRFGETKARPDAVLRLHDKGVARALVLRPRLAFGEAYMDGRLTIEKGTLAEVLDLLANNADVAGLLPFDRLADHFAAATRVVHQRNLLSRSAANAAHHYDLSRRLYELFLDPDLQYSCAYFATPGLTLEEAQEAKKRLIAAKLCLKPGQSVLDIGCGWGGLALSLARHAEISVTGITLSAQQLTVARERAEAAGLSHRVRFEMRDYRTMRGSFDRIVSVGMFEHVGVPHYGDFFQQVAALLAGDGVALLHAIGRSEGPGTTNPWFRRYIFPGGYSPALSEVLPAVETSGLWVTDLEILRLHYAETLKAWRERFAANRATVADLQGERFCRMWEFYLAGAEMSFRRQGHMVFHLQLAKQADAVPRTHDYLRHGR